MIIDMNHLKNVWNLLLWFDKIKLSKKYIKIKETLIKKKNP